MNTQQYLGNEKSYLRFAGGKTTKLLVPFAIRNLTKKLNIDTNV